MNAEYMEALKEAPFDELLLASWKLRARRNIAVAVCVIITFVIAWWRWSPWTLVVPGLICLAAAGQSAHLKLVEGEMRERKAESDRKAKNREEEELAKAAKPPRIVLLEDDEQLLEMLADVIRTRFEKATLLAFSDPVEAVQELGREDPAVLVTNWTMPRIGGG